jgi:hypothetical protein
MSYAYDQAVLSTRGLKQGESSIEDINAWWDDTHRLFRNDQEGFQKWTQENPEMAIRWHARAANDNVNTDWDSKKHHQMAQALSLGKAMEMGYGEDMKKDGKMLAFDYDTFKDVNNEWGAGDFWKIGTPQTLDKGFGAFIDNLDLKDVAMMAAPFVLGPMVGPALASMGLSAPAQAALTPAIMSGLQGGDLTDIVKSGGQGWLEQYLPGILKDLDMPEFGGGDFQLPDWMKDVGEGAKDIYAEVRDWGKGVLDGVPEWATPGFGDGDWGDTFGGAGELFGDIASIFGDSFGPQEQQQAAMMAMAQPKPEPTELAELSPYPTLQPLAHPVPDMGIPPLQPKGLFS